MKTKQKQQGFTLIELLVVISVIAMLASVILVALNNTRIKARDAKRKTDIAQLQKGLELYYAANGSYPASGGSTQINAQWSSSNDASWTTLQTLLQPYVASLPVDPRQTLGNVLLNATGNSPVYAYAYYGGPLNCASGQEYALVYQLERPDITSPGHTSCGANTYQWGTANITIGGRASNN
jgi:general secretion pathway protein G